MKYFLPFSVAILISLVSCQSEADLIFRERPLYLEIANNGESIYVEGSEVNYEDRFYNKTIIENGTTKLLTGCSSKGENTGIDLDIIFTYNGLLKGKTQNIIGVGKYQSIQLNDNLYINIQYKDFDHKQWVLRTENVAFEILSQEPYFSRIDGVLKNLISMNFSIDMEDSNGNIKHYLGTIQTIIEGNLD